MKALVIDTETHDSTDPALVEYGHIDCAFFDGTFMIGRGVDLPGLMIRPMAHVERYNPMKPISYGATATHGYADEDVAGFPPCTEFVRTEADYIIGHQIDFDAGVIGDTTAKRICSLALSRSIWPETSHKLLALIYMLDRDKAKAWHKSAHGVEADIEMCAFLTFEICKRLNITDMESLYQASEKARIPTVMSFSKFQGQPVSKVENGWRDWYRRQDNPDPYLLKAFDQQPYRP